MPSISITFEGENWYEVRTRVYDAFGLDHPAQPSTAGSEIEPAPVREPDPAPEPTLSAPKPKKSAPKTPAPKPPVEPEAEPEPEPEAIPTPAPQPKASEQPSLETLKAMVTQAVLAARKGNGAEHKITALLPVFKAKTGLQFVMEAKEEHRGALHDLVVEAGLV
jgi:hypothetical protein